MAHSATGHCATAAVTWTLRGFSNFKALSLQPKKLCAVARTSAHTYCSTSCIENFGERLNLFPANKHSRGAAKTGFCGNHFIFQLLAACWWCLRSTRRRIAHFDCLGVNQIIWIALNTVWTLELANEPSVTHAYPTYARITCADSTMTNERSPPAGFEMLCFCSERVSRWCLSGSSLVSAPGLARVVHG